MSAWGLLALPLIAQAAETGTTTFETTPSELASPTAAGAIDLFEGVAALDENALGNAAGGADVATDIGLLGINASESNGDVDDTYVKNTQTGSISDNIIQGNDGITFQVNNSGNGVVVQNTVNINIFTDGN